MEKINVAQLLKDCPKGMELDCRMFDVKVFYQGLNKRVSTPTHPIVVQTEHGFEFELTQYGQIHNIVGSKCVIFPKGKTTWEGFHRPFRDGDIVAFDDPYSDNLQVFIFKNKEENSTLSSCYLMLDGDVLALEEGMYYVTRLATDEEKQKLFDAIKENGYSWNPETKTLEKLIEPKFKVGDRIKTIYKNFQYDIKDLTDTHYTLVEVVDKFEYTEPIIEDKNWELVPNKFDITTLKPFDKVLVRDNDEQVWTADMFSFYNEKHVYPFMCVGHYTNQCIPYDQNKHLLGTTNGCDEFYKTWK